MNKDWPFTDATNTAAFVSRYVLEGEPICRVYHDWDDGAWQFHPDRDPEQPDIRIVCLEHVYELDPSIGELHDLPYGWKAERCNPHAPWTRSRHHPYPVFEENGFYLDDATAYSKFCNIPDAKDRESLQAGQSVKLIFRFADEWSERRGNDSENMWVELIEVNNDYGDYRGRLLNQPLLHSAINKGDELWFHPTHVFAIAD
ncbi:hypothetical protein [Prosthecobacter vanneervenii]|uniref:DUF2314 domain-containing protein n=1 Tax=Prosthecobacter vanneervenii TaxID=48466 RepID=A0A7W7YE49_9BACT|nr:hypothetical protein [Prosthecobacter vanneervenii]MBB5034522.1 hypothetical protein [Prosthecobacter vanneervenii]